MKSQMWLSCFCQGLIRPIPDVKAIQNALPAGLNTCNTYLLNIIHSGSVVCSVAQLYLDAAVVCREPVVPHWDRRGINLSIYHTITQFETSNNNVTIHPHVSLLRSCRPCSLPPSKLMAVPTVRMSARGRTAQRSCCSKGSESKDEVLLAL